MDNGVTIITKPINHATDGPTTDQVTDPALGVESPANARKAYTNWEMGWLRTIGWIHLGNCSSGWIPTHSNPKIIWGSNSNCVVASGFRELVPITSPMNDSAAPTTSTSTQKPTA